MTKLFLISLISNHVISGFSFFIKRVVSRAIVIVLSEFGTISGINVNLWIFTVLFQCLWESIGDIRKFPTLLFSVVEFLQRFWTFIISFIMEECVKSLSGIVS